MLLKERFSKSVLRGKKGTKKNVFKFFLNLFTTKSKFSLELFCILANIGVSKVRETIKINCLGSNLV